MRPYNYPQFYEQCLIQSDIQDESLVHDNKAWSSNTDKEYLNGLITADCTSTMMSKQNRFRYTIPHGVYAMLEIFDDPSNEIEYITYDEELYTKFHEVVSSIVLNHKMVAFILDEITDDGIMFRGGGSIKKKIVPVDKYPPHIYIHTSSIVNTVLGHRIPYVLHLRPNPKLKWYHVVKDYEWNGLKFS